MPHLVWSKRARFDLLRLELFLEEVNPGAAPQAIGTIRRELRILEKMPELGRIVDGPQQRREWLIRFGKAAYVVLYTIDRDEIVVRAVRHSREAGF